MRRYFADSARRNVHESAFIKDRGISGDTEEMVYTLRDIIKEYSMETTNSPSTSVQPHIVFPLEPLEVVNLYNPISR